MFKTVLRAAPRQIATSRSLLVNNSRRFINTAPPTKKSRSLKSSLARWGIAGGIVYFYINNDFFADETEAAIEGLDESIHRVQESKLQTVDAIVEQKRLRAAQQAEENKKTEGNVERVATAGGEEAESEDEGLEGLEEEAGQQGAFNPETGEINWDCPCLGGMAHGPCGEEFRAAFSCFVYSTEEPKGVECIEKFKGMQDCFRAHPETYGAELEEDEDDLEDEIRAQEVEKEQSKFGSTAQKIEATTPQSQPKVDPSQEDAPKAVLKTEEAAPTKPAGEPPKAATDAPSK